MGIVTSIAPIALAIIMLCLGASLTVSDFSRVIKNPKVTNIEKFIETGMKFFEDFDKLEHIGSMYTFRTVLRDREHDDARPTLVRKEKAPYNMYSLFSGKITTCVDATNELIKLVNQEKLYG